MQNGCYISTYKWPISQKSFLKFNSKASVLEILRSEVRREGETSEDSMSNKHGQHPDPFKASDPEDTLLKLTGELCALFYELQTLRIMSNRCWSASGHLSHMRDGSLSTYSAIDLHFFFSQLQVNVARAINILSDGLRFQKENYIIQISYLTLRPKNLEFEPSRDPLQSLLVVSFLL